MPDGWAADLAVVTAVTGERMIDETSFGLSYPKRAADLPDESDPLATMCRVYGVPLQPSWEALDAATKHLWMAPKFLAEEKVAK